MPIIDPLAPTEIELLVKVESKNPPIPRNSQNKFSCFTRKHIKSEEFETFNFRFKLTSKHKLNSYIKHNMKKISV
jgi:hypothetical protein